MKLLLMIFSLILSFSANICMAQVPVRVSFKFILDAGGSRPATGNLNTDAEVGDQLERGNNALAFDKSELRIDNLEIVDVAGISQWFNVDRDQLEALRSAATSNPTLYSWRNDAINVYINGFCTGGRALFPPTNDIIIIGQCCTGDVLIHEMGHSFSLYHTHENDGCADTIADDPSWDRDDIALNNFGDVYDNLTTQQKALVDIVWFNIMSYHAGDVLSQCQMDRMSTQGYDDRSWIYSREPIYVNSAAIGSFPTGSFVNPYKFLDSALNAWNINGKVLVLQNGSYTTVEPQIDEVIEVVTRFGDSTIARSATESDVLYTLPVNLESESKSAYVRDAISDVKENDRNGKPDKAIEKLIEAEAYAQDKEKIAIQLELAQRYRHSQNYEKAVEYYNLVAEATEQKHLREEALRLVEVCKAKLRSDRKGKEENQEKEKQEEEGSK
jgi:hypothetical protein